MISCPNCTHQNPDGANFCTRCGTSLAGIAPHQSFPPTALPPSSYQRSRHGVLVAIILGSSLAIAGIMVVVAFNRPSNTPEATEAISERERIATTPTTSPQNAETPAPFSNQPTGGSTGQPTSPTASPRPPQPTRRSPAPTSEGSNPTDSTDISVANASQWRVVDPDGLNCRSGAGTENPIQETFPEGTELQTSAENGDPILFDKDGNPWLAVSQAGLTCYVRANRTFIAEAANSGTEASTQPNRRQARTGTCPPNTEALSRYETRNFTIYICSQGIAQMEPGYYVGTAKDGSGAITLPVDRVTEHGYFARNGNTEYNVDPIAQVLRVYENDQMLVSEQVIAQESLK